ncbi:hypothetical protein AUEXF2481DRAFT_31139 [Aureobasidium subglaciale EXF-2481]|uniref:PB1 domain-containing protein n=1 Tax=Aureobasidium subglaciale (strain EXF-2481) TaxID=1043005 RepID=A0A074Z3G7_AURSE|nr:uncharacterized protein AUEXF2481DRAFT_31139 [Aureobasidium subglaciale EXF-2481]KAI5212889.1 hypothetical protein E4T38_00123 [Aureobasidium subglaciale]KAI5232397.1 hypothetical protein E4T40_00123 [Aureobasidium subglaciale]KAI5234719.1 hypothetical protein E4T41_00123 [Aureobasidium subglaciale]KAI5268513.1 hypothetical protein E4T46_00123 [Aureobasidium subglaciale]KEQ93566.1 hypothetical protein AUEXF2481DRAFT_31139 [Aureobasidium subglaciale EXF-2481]
MSLKQEIETWVRALEHYDNNEFDSALRAFMTVADTSKILFNCAVIHATLGEHTQAVQCYQRAVYFDQYMAIAYFQQGVSNFLLGDFEEALANFNDTLLYLRGNRWIDYDQLGLKFKLHSCEALFNRGLCYIYLQQRSAGLQDLFYASKEKAVPDHDVIDEAIREQAEGYTVFSIPVGIVYRPNEAKVKNIKSKNYLGTSTLVRAQDRSNQVYLDTRRNLTAASFAADDRPDEKLSYAALNLVRPGLSSRARQQSEPPIHRNIFPPTPPPESERATSTTMTNAKRKSSESTASLPSGLHQRRSSISKPAKLDLGAAAFEQASSSTTCLVIEKPRLGTKRSASERPPARDTHPSRSSPPRVQERNRHSDTHQPTEDSHVLRPDVYTPDTVSTAIQQALSEPEKLQPAAYHHQRNRSGGQSLREYPRSIAEEDETPEEVKDIRAHTTIDKSLQALQATISNALPYEITPAISPPAAVPTLCKIRVKVFATDTRYVMIQPNVTYEMFVEQIRKKFGYAGRDSFKLKMKDEEGDMVTMGDEDDLEMLVMTAKEQAGKDGAEMGKMEVWVQELA